MMRSALSRIAPRFVRAPLRTSLNVQRRSFFNDGYADNASLETIYKVMLRTKEVRRKLLEHVGKTADTASFENLKESASKTKLRIVLTPELGDPHRVLLQYSFMVDDPIEVGIDGCPVYEVDFGEERQKIKIVDAQLVVFLARTLLTTLDKDASPHGAKQYLDSLVGMTDEEFDATQAVPEPYRLDDKSVWEQTVDKQHWDETNILNMAYPARLFDQLEEAKEHGYDDQVYLKFRYSRKIPVNKMKSVELINKSEIDHENIKTVHTA